MTTGTARGTAGLGAALSQQPPNPTKACSPGATNTQTQPLHPPAQSGVLGVRCRTNLFSWSHCPAPPRELLGPAQGSKT